MNRREAFELIEASCERLEDTSLGHVVPIASEIRSALLDLALEGERGGERMVKLSLASGADAFVRPCEVAMLHGAVGDETQTVIVFRYENGGRGLSTRVLGSAEHVARALGLYAEGA